MIRLVIVALTIVLFLILSIPVLIIEWIIGKFNPRARDISSLRIIQGVFRLIFWETGSHLTVIGEENIPKDETVLYVGNHRSYFDVVTAYSRCPDLTGFVAKDNLQKILKEIRKDDAFDMEEALRQKLGDLCETYYVENADKIIDSLVQMFFELTATNNPELEGRLFFNRLSHNQQEIKTLLVTELLEIKNELSFISEVSYGLRK